MKNQCKKPQEYDVLWLSIISNTVFSDGRRGAHLISSDRKTEGFKAFCCCFGDEVFLLACFVGEFFLLTFLFPITYQDTTAEICGLQNMLINVISDRRFYFFIPHTFVMILTCNSSFQVLWIQRQRASFYLLARTYQFLMHPVPYLPWLWKAFK